MSNERFVYGDRVRHARRPEWGVGSVVKTEELPVNGQRAQRLSVRFPSVGVKALITSGAEIERVLDEGHAPSGDADAPAAASFWEGLDEEDWLAPVARKKIEEAMITIPERARDPFNGLRGRLEATVELYRFDRTGHGLIDWAVAQTSLDDPLSRFNRHELEQYFDRWAIERDLHLGRLVQEAASDQSLLREVLAAGPAPARQAARRLGAVR